MKEQQITEEHCNPLSKELLEIMQGNCMRHYAQREFRDYFENFHKIETPLPLERMLMIVEKHRPGALESNVDLERLCAFGRDAEEGYVIPGTSTSEYQAFTHEFLEAPDFPYTPQEASTVGNFLLHISSQRNSEFITDKIVLRKCLDKVEDVRMREKIWYALTLHSSDRGSLKHLKKEHPDEVSSIISEMKEHVLPAYEVFLNELIDYRKANSTNILGVEMGNGGIDSHGNIASVRKSHIWHIIDVFGYDLQQDIKRKIDQHE